MSIAALIASALVVQAPAPKEAIEVAFVEMAAGRSEAAIERIANADTRDAANPARLINLGIAHARMGDRQQARALFEQAAVAERFRLETASGEWMDSRAIARQAIAMLDSGAFSRTQFAAR